MSGDDSIVKLKPEENYRAFVGPPEKYDYLAIMQFALLCFLGLRDYHRLLDIGCGSLRAGRLFIPYLNPGNYFGVEPESWLVEEGIRNEVGYDLILTKKPTFRYVNNWSFAEFGVRFDFILAQSIFSHSSIAQIKDCLFNTSKVMHTKSIAAITFCEANKDYTGSEWVYPGVAKYKPSTIKSVIRTQGLIFQRISWPHPLQKWYLVCLPYNSRRLWLLGKWISLVGGALKLKENLRPFAKFLVAN